MHDLLQTTPLWGTEPRVDQFTAVTVTEVTGRALASLSLRNVNQDKARAQAEAFLGLSLPEANGHANTSVFEATWLAPDQWLISADIAEREHLSDQLAESLSGLASVTEQTDGWCRFDLNGVCAPVLERLASTDLPGMASQSAARVLLEHLSCLVICREAEQSYGILGQRSTARALHHALVTAAGAVS